MLNFYKTDCIHITNVSETLTEENSIAVSPDGLVTLSFYVPNVAAGIRIYRSTLTVDGDGIPITGPDTETLLVDISLDDKLRNKPIVSSLFSFVDDGSLSLSSTSYPLTTALTVEEQRAIPIPDVNLSTTSGGTLAENTYYYRVSFYTKADIAPVFSAKEMYVKFYSPDATEVMVYSRQDLSSETAYTLISDPFTYIENIMDDLNFSGITLGVESLYEQQLVVDGQVKKKNIYQQIPVIISTTDSVVLNTKPVILDVIPNDVRIEVIENLLIGPTEYFLGTVSKMFVDPGSVVYFLSERAKFLFNLSGGSFKVIT